jgi:hypothetical protein
MAGLKHLISPESSLSATEVAENFSAIGDRCNDLPDDAFEGSSLTTRHFDRKSVGVTNWSAGIDRFKSTRSGSFTGQSIPDASYGDIAGAVTPSQSLANFYGGELALPVFAWAEISFYDFYALPYAGIWRSDTENITYHFKLQYKTDLMSGWEDIPNIDTERSAQAGSATSGDYTAPPEEATMVLFGVVSPGSASSISFKLVGHRNAAGSSIPRVDGSIRSLYVVR